VLDILRPERVETLVLDSPGPHQPTLESHLRPWRLVAPASQPMGDLHSVHLRHQPMLSLQQLLTPPVPAAPLRAGARPSSKGRDRAPAAAAAGGYGGGPSLSGHTRMAAAASAVAQRVTTGTQLAAPGAGSSHPRAGGSPAARPVLTFPSHRPPSAPAFTSAAAPPASRQLAAQLAAAGNSSGSQLLQRQVLTSTPPRAPTAPAALAAVAAAAAAMQPARTTPAVARQPPAQQQQAPTPPAARQAVSGQAAKQGGDVAGASPSGRQGQGSAPKPAGGARGAQQGAQRDSKNYIGVSQVG
jgi:hypothetical protein